MQLFFFFFSHREHTQGKLTALITDPVFPFILAHRVYRVYTKRHAATPRDEHVTMLLR